MPIYDTPATWQDPRPRCPRTGMFLPWGDTDYRPDIEEFDDDESDDFDDYDYDDEDDDE